MADEAMPAQLAELYDGDLVFPQDCVYANFVGSIDGIVALDSGTAPSGRIISGRNEADRFVMGLLRAFADAVLVGAGTVRAEGPNAMWTSQFIFPGAAAAFADLRQQRKQSNEPRLVIVTGSGDLNPGQKALEVGALVLTTDAAAERLRKSLPSATEVRAISQDDRLGVGEILAALRAEGYRSILTEGGPQLFGQLVREDHISELFMTVSPTLIGRLGDQAFGLIHGTSFGRKPKWSSLLSVRRHESHLFLRYALK